MMDRRAFLHRAALIAAGVIAADQIDLLERLAPRRLFPSGALDNRVASVASVELAHWNEMYFGLSDIMTATSLHGLSSSTYAEWRCGPAPYIAVRT